MATAKTSTSQGLGKGEDIEETVRKARQAAIEMMRKAGYDIGTKVKVVVDPNLPFMGYTMPQGGNFTIVVSGGAVGSGLLERLLMPDTSHVYRLHHKYPSHRGQVLDDAV